MQTRGVENYYAKKEPNPPTSSPPKKKKKLLPTSFLHEQLHHLSSRRLHQHHCGSVFNHIYLSGGFTHTSWTAASTKTPRRRLGEQYAGATDWILYFRADLPYRVFAVTRPPGLQHFWGMQPPIFNQVPVTKKKKLPYFFIDITAAASSTASLHPAVPAVCLRGIHEFLSRPQKNRDL